MTIYLDYNATTPVAPEVLDVVRYYMEIEFGNAGSRTHEYGARARKAVEEARVVVAEELAIRSEDLIFTSGATEANNLAILGIEPEGRRTGRMHLVSSLIEHKAVLEPLAQLERRGFEVTLLKPAASGVVPASALRDVVREDTLLVSLMHVNNETGVIQDIAGYCRVLEAYEAFLHIDAAQSFARVGGLTHPRIDMVSVSGHKIGAPKGIGALGLRRRGWSRIPLSPLMFGGGQEAGLRPGTVPVSLVAGLGAAVTTWSVDRAQRLGACRSLQKQLMDGIHGSMVKPLFDVDLVAPWVAPLWVEGVDAEAALLRTKGILAISNGAACSSSSYAPSHVLEAICPGRASNFLRVSWGPSVSSDAIAQAASFLCTLAPSIHSREA